MFGAFDPPHALQAAVDPGQPVDPFTTGVTSMPMTPAAPLPGPTALSPHTPPTSAPAASNPKPTSGTGQGDPSAGSSGASPAGPGQGFGSGTDPDLAKPAPGDGTPGNDQGSHSQGGDPGSDSGGALDPHGSSSGGHSSGGDNDPHASDSQSDPSSGSDPSHPDQGGSSDPGSTAGGNIAGILGSEHGSVPGSKGGSNADPGNPKEPTGSTIASMLGFNPGRGGKSDPGSKGASDADPGNVKEPASNAIASILGINPDRGGTSDPGALSNLGDGSGSGSESGSGFGSGSGSGSESGLDSDGNHPSNDNSSPGLPVVVDGSESGQAKEGAKSPPSGDPSGAIYKAPDGSPHTAFQLPGSPGRAVVDGHTFSVGGAPVILNGATLSEGPSGINVVHGVSTQNIAFSQLAAHSGTTDGEVVFTEADGSVHTATYRLSGSAGVVNVAGHTLSVSDSALTVNGEITGESASGLFVGDGSQTINGPSSMITGAPKIAELEAVFIGTDGLQITAYAVPDASGIIEVDGHTLSIGGSAAVIDGMTVRDGNGGLTVVDGGKSTVIPFSTVTEAADVEAVFTGTDGEVITAWEMPGMSGVASIDGEILSAGGPAKIIDGELISDGPNGLVIQDSTMTANVPFSTAATATTSESDAPNETGGAIASTAALASGSRNVFAKCLERLLRLSFAYAVGFAIFLQL